MAETPPQMRQPPPTPATTVPNNPNSTQYWCYQCDKRVPVEARPDQQDVVCFECKNGFVESIAVRSPHTRDIVDDETPALSNDIIRFLRAIASTEDDDEAPPPPHDGTADDDDHLRIELQGWDAANDNGDSNHNQGNGAQDGSDDENEEEDGDEEGFRRRHRRHMLRLQLREYGLAAGRRDRILDWAELLLQLEDQSVEFGLQRLEFDDDYVGNPGDYVDAAGYDALLENMADNDSSGRNGAPPAGKWAIEALKIVVVKASDTELCAICKDGVFNDEEKIVKELPCGHMYHGECIVRWLDSRNTCPICRYELPTDDPEYEEDKNKRWPAMASTTDHGGSSSSGSRV